jgi:hypothetical protein
MSLSVVEWLQSIRVPVSEATQENLDDECVDVHAIMGLNDDQLRELGFSKMRDIARPSSRSSGVHLLSTRGCLFAFMNLLRCNGYPRPGLQG